MATIRVGGGGGSISQRRNIYYIITSRTKIFAIRVCVESFFLDVDLSL